MLRQLSEPATAPVGRALMVLRAARLHHPDSTPIDPEKAAEPIGMHGNLESEFPCGFFVHDSS